MKEKYNHLIWLGAGSGTEPASIIQSAEHVTLVDARSEACAQLRKKFPQNHVKIEQLLISTDAKDAVFTEYNLSEYSSIKPASGIKILFPGIRSVTSNILETSSITDFIKKRISTDNNALVIDIFDLGLGFLKALQTTGQLDLFRNVQIHTAIEPTYVDSATADEVIDFLNQNGYLLSMKNGSDPELPWLTFEINPLWARIKEEGSLVKHLQAELNTTKNQLTATQKELESKNSELASASKLLEELKLELKAAQVTFDKKLHDSNINNEKSGAPQAKDVEQQLQKILQAQNQELSKAVGAIKNHINSSLGNTAKQLEAFIGIQNYLENGIKPLSFHGWPISPDIGLYLTSLIDANNYDVIIEFGSGTSTVLMAKALTAKHRSSELKTLKNQASDNLPAKTDRIAFDVLARIVTFEHHKTYHEKTYKALKDNGVDHLVDLVYAPLTEYKYKEENQYLYYSCNEKLLEIARILRGRQANILIVVDGPPGVTNKHARFPALPHVLSNISEHTFTVIMDDYNRAEEKEIVDLWMKICDQRSITYSLEEIACEKGMAVLTLNKF